MYNFINLSYIFLSNLQFIAASIPNHSPYKLIELINYGAFIAYTLDRMKW